MKAILAPSLLSADFANLGLECQTLEKAGIQWLHLDVIDGSFAPNITFGAPVIKALRPLTAMFFDVHLMVENPERFFDSFAVAGADLLVPHIEGMHHACRSLERIRELNLKAGIALNPDTDITVLRWLLPFIDLVLIMGVNPGFSGQKFINSTLVKVKECREYLNHYGYDKIIIEVDGGVCLENAPDLITAGASALVSGSAFFKLGDNSKAYSKYQNKMEEAVIDEYNGVALAEAQTWAHR